MKKLKENKKFIIGFILGAILFSSITVYAVTKYNASQVKYKNTTLDQALDTLYTIQNTTVNNLNSQITTKDQTISSLQSQVESLTAAASEKDYVTGTFTFPTTGNKDCDLGFRPSKLLLYYTSNSMSAFIYYSGSYNYWTTVLDSSGFNEYNAEYFESTSTGFRIKYADTSWVESGKTFNYVAFK